MNFKVTLVLLVLVLAGFAAFLWVKKTEVEEGKKPTVADVKAGKELWPESGRMSSTDVGVVTIETGGKTYEFTRDAAPSVTSANASAPEPQWNQTRPVVFPINGYRINALVADVYGLRYSAQGKPGEQNLPSLVDAGLSPAKATITLAALPEPATTKPSEKHSPMTLKVGNSVGIGGTAYVMINDDPRLFVVRDDVQKAINKPNFDEFRQTTLVAPVEGRARHVVLERVTPGGKEPRVLAMTKNDGLWSFDSPLTGRVDKDQVSAALSAVSSFYAGNFVSEDASRLPIYGLDQPSITLTASAPLQAAPGSKESAESKCTLRIGNAADLTRDNFYATWSTTATPSPVVFTVTRSVVDSLSKDADSFRDKRVALVSASDVVQFQIEHPGSTVGFSKSPAGWSFSPLNPLFTAESSAVSKIVDSLAALTAEKFVMDAPADSKPFATIKITATGHPEPDVLRLYSDQPLNPKPKTYTAYRNGETVGYVISAEKLAPFFLNPTDVRSLTALAFSAGDVKKVTLTQADSAGPLVFERAVSPATTQSSAPGVWKLAGHDKFESSAFDSMLRSFLPLKAEQWLGEPASSLAKGDIVLTLERGTGTPITLTIDSASRHASVSTDAALFSLPAGIISKTQGEFLDRNVLPVSGQDVTALTITDQGGKPCDIVRDAASGFIAIDGRKLDTAAVNKIVDTVADLRVEHYRRTADATPVTRTIVVTAGKGDQVTLMLHSGNRASVKGKIGGADIERHFQLDATSMTSLQAKLSAAKAEPEVHEDN